MKKLLSLILAVCMLMSAVYAFPVNTAAAATSGTCGDNLTWEYDSSTYTLTISGTGAMTGYDCGLYNRTYVTTAPWRPYYNTMKTVIIGDGVTSIGSSAFYHCTSLTSVTIPDSVTSIGEGAFTWCTSLTSVTIPDSVTSIGNYAFSDCTSLTSITVSDKNTAYSLQDGVLFNKDKTELIQYPIGNARTEYTIPDSVKSIGDEAFYNCTSLTSVTIPDDLTSIGNYAFYGCTSLSYNTYDNGLYLGNENNPYVVLVKASSTDITSCKIADTTKFINSSAFSDCLSLTSVTIGNSVTSIGYEAFYSCTSLTDVYYKGTREQWNSISIGSYNDNLKNAHFHIWCEKYGHIFDEITETVPATCTEEGYKTGICSVCGETVTEVLPLHSATINRMEIPATCTRDGMFTEVCTECGTTVSAGTIPAKGHTSATETVDSTCTVDGYSKVYCSVCNEVLSNTVIPAAHKEATSTVPATCTEDGKTTVSCTVCFETLSETVIPKLGHNYKSTVTAPTCTADGYTTHTCSRCTDTYTDNIVTKLGHEPKRTEVPATCTESGMYFEQCSVCSAFLSSGMIDPLGHYYVNDICTRCYFNIYGIEQGDIDADAKITAKDVNLLKQIVIGTADKVLAADLNADGKITSADINMLKVKMLGTN